ncbi:methyltransferase family protein [Hydromonas duriensis]|uniref:Protein-S-isoprenylcysteine O-methyltransferase Ste14 n=1 Tax=Hydromonas duriensis TaxID=1527608 RepID=A0A4R6Y970_9BURK|nr:isoprenylcysteine carboxylmethyltransferase family protein [Hydromonas duriensis]TDR31978.1 protein-S-isoprenylcysteine O-methyltransferase Ste14 [Hydromonas duriensis]
MLNFLNIRIYPLLLMAILLLAQLIFGRFIKFSLALANASGMTALALLLIGVVLIMWAGLQFRIHNTSVNPSKTATTLVTTWLFRLSRNPMYLGMLLILMVQPLLALRPHLLIFTAVFFIIMNYLVIPREERMMLNTFGEHYQNYCAQTRRWI